MTLQKTGPTRNKTYTAFLSCSFSPENRALNQFFKDLLAALDFNPIVYDYQEPRRVAEGVQDIINRCDCVVAVVPRGEELEGSENPVSWACPAWIQNELTLAFACRKPVAIFHERNVKLEGLIASEMRRQEFSRESLVDDIPLLVKYLFELRSELEFTAPNLPEVFRHYLRVQEDIKSADTTEVRVEVLLECVVETLEEIHHFSELEDLTPGLSVRPERFEFECKEAPVGVRVEPQIVRSTDEKHSWHVRFSPPLRRGDKVRYAFMTVQQNRRPWTLEELERRLKEETYKYGRPICAACEWTMTYPTGEFEFTIDFPAHYEIGGLEVDVREGDVGRVNASEANRARAMLTAENIFHKWSLRLSVPRPLQDHTYYIYYVPSV